MNRSVKIILVLAIGLLYPVVVYLLTTVVFPYPESPYVSQPKQPDYSSCNNRSSGSSRDYSWSTYDDSYCRDKIREEYDSKLETYNSSRDSYTSQQGAITIHRVKLALVFVIIGYLVAFSAYKIPAISAGLLSGSTILVVFALLFIEIEYIDSILVSLLLLLFIILVVMLFMVEKIIPKSLLAKSENTQSQAQAQAQADKPEEISGKKEEPSSSPDTKNKAK